MSWNCKRIQHSCSANYIHKFSLNKEDESNLLKYNEIMSMTQTVILLLNACLHRIIQS